VIVVDRRIMGKNIELLGLAQLTRRASEVFDDPVAAGDWLNSANAALRGNAPLSLLDTDIGAESVLDTLGRMSMACSASAAKPAV
jgi:uncharacterized protein (DUF2384 family)